MVHQKTGRSEAERGVSSKSTKAAGKVLVQWAFNQCEGVLTYNTQANTEQEKREKGEGAYQAWMKVNSRRHVKIGW